MASIVTRGNGCTEIQFRDSEGRRKAVRLGACSASDAETIRGHIRRLLNAQALSRSPERSTAIWLSEIGSKLHARIAATGICPPREAKGAPETLAAFVESYIAKRSDLSLATVLNLRQAQTTLVGYFGKSKRLGDITPADAKGYKRWLGSANFGTEKRPRFYSPSTVAKHVKKARELFKFAVDARLIDASPFAAVTAGKMTNPERAHFVARDAVAKILEHCPDIDWRLIVSLSRFGGLRCPSEVMGLRWGDILWDEGRMVVRSPKTAKQGKPFRHVPIFPELRALLMDALEQAEEGAEFVVSRHRDSTVNLRTHMLRLIERAGLLPWPRLFHNMRATRQTELEESYPSHVVCAWLGNSEAVAKAHYLQVTDEHFKSAAAGSAPRSTTAPQESASNPTRTDLPPFAKQQQAQPTGTDSDRHGKTGGNAKCEVSKESRTAGGFVGSRRGEKMALVGLEPTHPCG